MSKQKKIVREQFRNAVFERANYRCEKCGHLPDTSREPDLDAHHIIDRSEIDNGGYVPENGIALCAACHINAEMWFLQSDEYLHPYSPDNLFRIIGSSEEMAREASKKLSD